ncbi:MAG TPA: hypothetical protein VKA59_00890, partial [Vicinamibacterales bacterium]|nr:hypothetical protein [Vicinamibacterales bacterium]
MSDNQCRALRDFERQLLALARSLRDAAGTDDAVPGYAALCDRAAQQLHAAAETIDRLSDRLDAKGVAYELTAQRVRHAEAHQRVLRSDLN